MDLAVFTQGRKYLYVIKKWKEKIVYDEEKRTIEKKLFFISGIDVGI